MKAETLVRLYNIGKFHRTVTNSPSYLNVRVEIDDEPKLMKLSEVEDILRANLGQLRIALKNQKPIVVHRVAQPFAQAS